MKNNKTEPVAWMYSYIGGTEVQTSKERWTGSDWKSYWEETPLCIAQQPAEHQLDLHLFAKRMDEELEKHDIHGFKPVILAVAEEVLGCAPTAHRKGANDDL